MAQSNCRFFNGYKPCGKVDSLTDDCKSSCREFSAVSTRVLLIHLGALGAVVRSTALLPAIQRKYPGAHITWVTDGPGDVLLREHPLVDRVITANSDGVLALGALAFDVALVVDKSLKAAGILKATRVGKVFGFTVQSETGAIVPANEAAKSLWEIGLSNALKFNVNRKPETQLIHEALELGTWNRSRYSLHLNELEKLEVLKRRYLWSLGGRSSVIGMNTGCASTIAAKKLSVEGHVQLIAEIDRQYGMWVTDGRGERGSEGLIEQNASIVLLGGKEDSQRNREIAAQAGALGLLVTESSTEAGLRDGMISVAACDVVVSGDSLGMHMAIGFNKPVVAWFGPTCAHEVDLYGGVAVVTQAPCSPCWKRSCEKPSMCYDQVDFAKMATATVGFALAAHNDRRSVAVEPGAPILEISADL